jgi:hypothetical protein
MTRPITPLPELVARFWREASAGREDAPIGEIFNHGVYLAYQAGADQELEACLVEASFLASRSLADRIRAARRPKPSSLKEQALAIMSTDSWSIEDEEIIRAALEALPND